MIESKALQEIYLEFDIDSQSNSMQTYNDLNFSCLRKFTYIYGTGAGSSKAG